MRTRHLQPRLARAVGVSFLLWLLAWSSALAAAPGATFGRGHLAENPPAAERPLPRAALAPTLAGNPANQENNQGTRPVPPAANAAVSLLLTEGLRVPVRAAMAGEKWIDVDLSAQRVTAYEGMTAVRTFIISSGLPRTPTVTGTFRIQSKVVAQLMEGGSREDGDYYYLPNVPWVQFFYQGYSFHGTYWHDKFGRPMSHGCINMRTEDAKWLFDWTEPALPPGQRRVRSTAETPGTLVIIHK